MKKYLLIVFIPLLIVSCSKTTDQEYFDQANNLLKEKKIDEAIKHFETLITEYPESNIAPKALIQLAGIYQNQMVKGLKTSESFNRAEKYFFEVYEKYPNSKDAPQSLFLSGFILANDLNDFDKATMRYKLFIEKYPSNSLAVSAKEELNNMGLTPEEILKKNETAKK